MNVESTITILLFICIHFCVHYTTCAAALWHDRIYLFLHESRAPVTWSSIVVRYGALVWVSHLDCNVECREKTVKPTSILEWNWTHNCVHPGFLLEINFVFCACICLSFYAIIGLSCNCFCMDYTKCNPRYIMIQGIYSRLDLSRWTERLSCGLLSSKIGSSLCSA